MNRIPEFKELLEFWLEAKGFDGVFCPGECACEKSELMPCDMIPEEVLDECEAGYKVMTPEHTEWDWMIQRTKDTIDPSKKDLHSESTIHKTGQNTNSYREQEGQIPDKDDDHKMLNSIVGDYDREIVRMRKVIEKVREWGNDYIHDDQPGAREFNAILSDTLDPSKKDLHSESTIHKTGQKEGEGE